MKGRGQWVLVHLSGDGFACWINLDHVDVIKPGASGTGAELLYREPRETIGVRETPEELLRQLGGDE